MAQIFYTTVPVMGAVEQPVELDFNNLFQPTVALNSDIQDNSIILDEGDIFQCGKCMHKFSFSDFVIHKKSSCRGSTQNLIVGNSQDYLNDEANVEVPPLVLDSNNLITLMQTNGNESDNLCQNFPNDIETNVVETSINLDVKPYRLVSNLPNIEVDNLLQENYMLNETKTASELEDEVVNCLSGQYSIKEENNVAQTKSFNISEIQKDVNSNNRNGIEETCPKLKCSFCGKPFRKNFDLQQHIRSHTGERPFLCVICGRAFTQKSNVIKHMVTHKVWPKKVCNLPKFHVQIDNTSASSLNSFQIGEKAIIAFDKSFPCQYCPSAFNSYIDWRVHMKSHVNFKVYKCIQKDCNLTFSDLDSFLEHTQSHCGMASYSCHICQQDFHSLDDLGQHQYIHNLEAKKSIKNFLCRKCGCKFSSQTALIEHKCNNFCCPLCNRRFSTARFLRRHLALHKAEPIYSCPDCDKTFKTPTYLSNHRLVHSNEKPYNCQVCSAAFNRRDKLVRHSLTHRATKKFKCPYMTSDGCTKEFNRKDKLKEHILTHIAKKSNGQHQLIDNISKVENDQLPRIEIVVVPIQVSKCQTTVLDCTPLELLKTDV